MKPTDKLAMIFSFILLLCILFFVNTASSNEQTYFQWAKHSVKESRLPNFIPSDIDAFCPRYRKMNPDQRAAWWTRLTIEIARHESKLNPKAILTECNKRTCIYIDCKYHEDLGHCMKGGHAKDGGLVISRGLGQISFGSALAYNCKVENPKDLHDAEINLDCMVRIIEKLAIQNGRVTGGRPGAWQGAARYWSVLRGTTEYTRTTKPKIERAIRCN